METPATTPGASSTLPRAPVEPSRRDAMAPDWYRRYLAMLGLDVQPPSLAYLNAIIRAHRSMPFECVSSLMRRHAAGLTGPVPSLDLNAILDGWERRAGGGVCYEFGAMLGALLNHLGYDARPNLANISFPGSHSALLVDFPEGRFIADVGNGQPIFEAIPVAEPFEFERAGLGYRFWLDASLGKLVQDRHEHGEWKSYVWYDLEPASDEEMEASMQRHHALPPMTFVMQNFRLVMLGEERVLQLRDHDLIRYQAGGKTVEEVYGLERYREVVAEEFGLTGLDVKAALDAWVAITGATI